MSDPRLHRDPPVPEELTAPVTEAGVVARLALDQRAVELFDVVDEDGVPLEQLVFGRGTAGESILLERIDTARHLSSPPTMAGHIRVRTPASLVTYCNRHLDPDRATLWGNVGAGTVTVILNDHEIGPDANRPVHGWADHRAALTLETSPEWQAWSSLTGKLVSQEELASFLEEHLHEIVRPDGATILEVAHRFHATSGAVFKRAHDPQSGQITFVYEETVDATAGSIEIPREFTIALRPFRGTDPVEITAALAYRMRQGSLTIGYRLLRLEEIRERAFAEVLEAVATELNLDPLEGTAPEPRR